MDVTIRDMRSSDLDICSKIAVAARIDLWEKHDHLVFSREYLRQELDMYRPEVLKRYVEDSDKYALVAGAGGKIVGVAVGRTGYGVSNLSWIAVDPEVQGMGVGRRLMEAVIERSKKLGCHKIVTYAFPVDASTIAFYLSIGFVPECFLREHWNKLDFVMMSKYLEPG